MPTTPMIMGGFNPLTVNGCAFLIEADSGYHLTGSNVNQMDDLSGNSRHVSQSDLTKQLAYLATAINGHPAIQGDGSNDFLQYTGLTGLNGLTGLTLVTVMAVPDTTTNMYHFALGNDDFRNSTIANTDLLVVTGIKYGSYTSVPTGPSVRIGIYDGSQVTDALKLKYIVNGIQKSMTFWGWPIPTILGNPSTITIGKNPTGAMVSTAQIAVVAMWPRTLLSSEWQYLQFGWAAKYGITI